MEDSFKVVRKFEPSTAAVKEGTREEIAHWLENRVDTSSLVIYNDADGTYISAEDFLRHKYVDRYEESRSTSPTCSTDKPGGIVKIENLNDWVEKYFSMTDTDEEIDILFDGTELRRGMIILIESPDGRQEIFSGMPDFMVAHAQLNNRWARIENVPEIEDGKVSFIAHYFDGEERKRVHDVDDAWYALVSSTPDVIRHEAIKEYLHKSLKERGVDISKDEHWFDDVVMGITEKFA